MKSVEVKYKDGEQEKVMIVKSPTASQLNEAQLVASKTFSRLINVKEDGVGLLVRAKLDKFLKDNNIWTDQDDKELASLDEKIKKKEKQLKTGKYKTQEAKLNGRKLALEIRDLRAERNTFASKKTQHNEYTIEEIADEARMNYLISSCLFHESGEAMFETVDEYMDNRNKPHVIEGMTKFYSMFYNADEDWYKKLPENQFLIQLGFVDDKFRFVMNGKLTDRDGRPVDEEGRYIDEEGNFVNKDGERLDKDGNVLFKFEE